MELQLQGRKALFLSFAYLRAVLYWFTAIAIDPCPRGLEVREEKGDNDE